MEIVFGGKCNFKMSEDILGISIFALWTHDRCSSNGSSKYRKWCSSDQDHWLFYQLSMNSLVGRINAAHGCSPQKGTQCIRRTSEYVGNAISYVHIHRFFNVTSICDSWVIYSWNYS